MEDPNTLDTITCPDGGNIVFKAYRIEDQMKPGLTEQSERKSDG